MLRATLLTAAFTGMLLTSPAHAQLYIDAHISTAPPALRYEPAPAPRPGYQWVQGYWDWRGDSYAWIPGNWIELRPGYVWVPDRWEQHDGKWRRWEGHWSHHDDWDEPRGKDHPPGKHKGWHKR